MRVLDAQSSEASFEVSENNLKENRATCPRRTLLFNLKIHRFNLRVYLEFGASPIKVRRNPRVCCSEFQNQNDLLPSFSKIDVYFMLGLDLSNSCTIHNKDKWQFINFFPNNLWRIRIMTNLWKGAVRIVRSSFVSSGSNF